MNRSLFRTLVLLSILAMMFQINGGCSSCSRSDERAAAEIKFVNGTSDTVMVCITDYTCKDCGLLLSFRPYQSRSIKRFQNGMDLLKLKYFTGMVPLDLYYVKEMNIITDSMRTPRK